MEVIKYGERCRTVRCHRLRACDTLIIHDISRLIDFFRFFSREFTYTAGVASIRAGLLTKESKNWQSEVGTCLCLHVLILILIQFEKGSLRERNRFCIEVSRFGYQP